MGLPMGSTIHTGIPEGSLMGNQGIKFEFEKPLLTFVQKNRGNPKRSFLNFKRK